MEQKEKDEKILINLLLSLNMENSEKKEKNIFSYYKKNISSIQTHNIKKIMYFIVVPLLL